MKLSAPKQITWWIALIIAVVAVLMVVGVITFLPFLAPYSFAMAIIAYVLLMLGTLLKGF